MVDQPASTETQPGSVCPWCSARLTPEAITCPSCGANLTSDEVRELPGVTAVDHEALRTIKKDPGRNRLLSWINGEYEPEGPSQVEAGALQRPDPDVQREILRLELEAEVANLQAEADARYAEAVVEGRVSDLPEGLQAIATGSTLSDVMAALEGPAQATTVTQPAPDVPVDTGAPAPAAEDTPAG
ncbi:MAG TPA: zinc ribbon domain-containing protein [Candidatus Limnocylindrales bacterium]|jgi:hypothetical protein|nr:zinc ribbon domain-containing protein [Candidatus Limnocylindrales bacterium]